MSTTAEMATRITLENEYLQEWSKLTLEELQRLDDNTRGFLEMARGDREYSRRLGLMGRYEQFRADAERLAQKRKYLLHYIALRRRSEVATLLNRSTREQARIDDLNGQLAASIDLRQAYLARAQELLLELTESTR